MGGYGSGARSHWWRGPKKTAVEQCRQLDAAQLTREGVLRADLRTQGRWCWWRDEARTEEKASIDYEVDTTAQPPWLRLYYRFLADGKAVNYRLGLAVTRPHFGGHRWWFICPLLINGRQCGRRVRKLYLPPHSSYFGCRHCHELTYTSCQESHKYDGLARGLARNLGSDSATVKRIIDGLGKGP